MADNIKRLWPTLLVAAAVAVMYVLENSGWLKADQVQNLFALVGIGGTLTGNLTSAPTFAREVAKAADDTQQTKP